MRESKHVIISTLDNVPRILFWDLYEFAVMVGPVFVGLACGSLGIMALSIPCKLLYSRYTRKYKGGLQHRMYWELPSSVLKRVGVVSKVPASHVREIAL